MASGSGAKQMEKMLEVDDDGDYTMREEVFRPVRLTPASPTTSKGDTTTRRLISALPKTKSAGPQGVIFSSETHEEENEQGGKNIDMLLKEREMRMRGAEAMEDATAMLEDGDLESIDADVQDRLERANFLFEGLANDEKVIATKNAEARKERYLKESSIREMNFHRFSKLVEDAGLSNAPSPPITTDKITPILALVLFGSSSYGAVLRDLVHHSLKQYSEVSSFPPPSLLSSIKSNLGALVPLDRIDYIAGSILATIQSASGTSPTLSKSVLDIDAFLSRCGFLLDVSLCVDGVTYDRELLGGGSVDHTRPCYDFQYKDGYLISTSTAEVSFSRPIDSMSSISPLPLNKQYPYSSFIMNDNNKPPTPATTLKSSTSSDCPSTTPAATQSTKPDKVPTLDELMTEHLPEVRSLKDLPDLSPSAEELAHPFQDDLALEDLDAWLNDFPGASDRAQPLFVGTPKADGDGLVRDTDIKIACGRGYIVDVGVTNIGYGSDCGLVSRSFITDPKGDRDYFLNQITLLSQALGDAPNGTFGNDLFYACVNGTRMVLYIYSYNSTLYSVFTGPAFRALFRKHGARLHIITTRSNAAFLHNDLRNADKYNRQMNFVEGFSNHNSVLFSISIVNYDTIPLGSFHSKLFLVSLATAFGFILSVKGANLGSAGHSLGSTSTTSCEDGATLIIPPGTDAYAEIFSNSSSRFEHFFLRGLILENTPASFALASDSGRAFKRQRNSVMHGRIVSANLNGKIKLDKKLRQLLPELAAPIGVLIPTVVEPPSILNSLTQKERLASRSKTSPKKAANQAANRSPDNPTPVLTFCLTCGLHWTMKIVDVEKSRARHTSICEHPHCTAGGINNGVSAFWVAGDDKRGEDEYAMKEAMILKRAIVYGFEGDDRKKLVKSIFTDKRFTFYSTIDHWYIGLKARLTNADAELSLIQHLEALPLNHPQRFKVSVLDTRQAHILTDILGPEIFVGGMVEPNRIAELVHWRSLRTTVPDGRIIRLTLQTLFEQHPKPKSSSKWPAIAKGSDPLRVNYTTEEISCCQELLRYFDDFTAEGRWEPKNSKRLRNAFARAVVRRFGLAENAHASVLYLDKELTAKATNAAFQTKVETFVKKCDIADLTASRTGESSQSSAIAEKSKEILRSRAMAAIVKKLHIYQGSPNEKTDEQTKFADAVLKYVSDLIDPPVVPVGTRQRKRNVNGGEGIDTPTPSQHKHKRLKGVGSEVPQSGSQETSEVILASESSPLSSIKPSRLAGLNFRKVPKIVADGPSVPAPTSNSISASIAGPAPTGNSFSASIAGPPPTSNSISSLPTPTTPISISVSPVYLRGDRLFFVQMAFIPDKYLYHKGFKARLMGHGGSSMRALTLKMAGGQLSLHDKYDPSRCYHLQQSKGGIQLQHRERSKMDSVMDILVSEINKVILDFDNSQSARYTRANTSQ